MVSGIVFRRVFRKPCDALDWRVTKTGKKPNRRGPGRIPAKSLSQQISTRKFKWQYSAGELRAVYTPKLNQKLLHPAPPNAVQR